jgi:hypothetical protein
MAYLLDANVFIEAKNRYYGFDICPGFWEWLTGEESAGRVLSVTSAKDELTGREDDLSVWVKSRPGSFFKGHEESSLGPLATLAAWARSRSYRPAAITEFLDSADYQLVAYAMAHRHTVVSHERTSDGVNRVKIPDACIAHGVEVINPFVMLRRCGCRFVLP